MPLPLAMITSLLLMLLCLAVPAAGQPAPPTGQAIKQEHVLVTASPLARHLSQSELPYHVQSLSGQELAEIDSVSLADALARRLNGVTLNHAQNNPLQPDVQVRGFSASPLLGAPQGVAVYLNGARVNEPFGDTVNWDLIDEVFIDRVSLISGANAAYGLNALGATLTVSTKTGFTADNTQLELSTGSFGRTQASLAGGDNNNQWGYYGAVSAFAEDGWRDHSPSEAYNGYGSLSYRSDKLTWDSYAFLAATDLHGNGAVPQALHHEDPKAVFTHPDITENRLRMLSSQADFAVSDTSSLLFNIFYRDNDTDTFNGDGSEFEECAQAPEVLCEETEESEEGAVVRDQTGSTLPVSFDAINNIGERSQQSYGATLEYSHEWQLHSRQHVSTLGLDYFRGETDFYSQVEFARLLPDRSTTRSGRFHPQGATDLSTTTRTTSAYWLNRLTLVPERAHMNLSLRYNVSDLETVDQSGMRPALNANHRFENLNGGLGARFRLTPGLVVQANYHRSSRTPTAVELACSHSEAPCTLPNTFLADPPLDAVVADNLEAGLAGSGHAMLDWRMTAFISKIEDDIVFHTTGGVSSNEGFFSNASDTERKGVSASLHKTWRRLAASLRYTWLRATYKTDFLASSPNHPKAADGRIPVQEGDDIPGLPDHSLSATLDWALHPRVDWFWAAHYRSGTYLRGDEGNLDDRTDDYTVVNTRIDYQWSGSTSLYLSIHNLFDTEAASFGLYGEPDEVLPNLNSETNRFVSPIAPRGAWIGLRHQW